GETIVRTGFAVKAVYSKEPSHPNWRESRSTLRGSKSVNKSVFKQRTNCARQMTSWSVVFAIEQLNLNGALRKSRSSPKRRCISVVVFSRCRTRSGELLAEN